MNSVGPILAQTGPRQEKRVRARAYVNFCTAPPRYSNNLRPTEGIVF
jgi:hypothetical protein